MQGQNTTPSSSLKNSQVEVFTRIVTSSPSATHRRTIITSNARPGTSSQNTHSRSGITQSDSTLHVESCTAFGIASTPTHLSGLENLPTPMPDPEAPVILTNQLRIQATERNQTQREWQLQMQAVSSPR